MAKDATPMQILEKGLLVLLGVSLCLDVPSARAYNEHESWTEGLGKFLFHGFKDLYGIPLPFTLFEILTYLSFIAMIWTFGWPRAKFWNLMAGTAVLIPASAFFGALVGMVRGNSLSLAATQLHVIPLIAAWLALGYFLGQRHGNALRLFRIIFYTSLFKALYALYVFAFIYGMTMGGREFLIDHPTSIYLTGGIVFGIWQLLKRDVSLKAKSFFLLAILCQSAAYLLNDRRASFTGALIAVILVPWILPRKIRRDIWPIYCTGAAVAAVAVVFMALISSDPYSFFGGFKGEVLRTELLTYRHIENFNLLSGVIKEPLLGLGFGTTYPQTIPLPDISHTFSLFAAIPHNTLYFLWTFAGPLGIGAFVTFALTIMMLITRCGAWARTSCQLFYAVLALVICCQWMSYVLFDMGLLEARSHMVFGLIIGSLYPQYARHLMEYYDERISEKK